jgi:hypothetical protein
MRKQDTFYAKVFILYLLIFISFLMKSYTKIEFLSAVISVPTSKKIAHFQDLFQYPFAPHQVR